MGLEGDTTGATIYRAVTEKLNKLGLSLIKCVSATTDGAPSMTGREQGLVARMKADNSALLAFHCIIHQSVLCGKLSGNFHDLMTNCMKMINYLKAKSALRHRRLREFLRNTDAQYDELLTHNNVRWLSKGNALERIWILRHDLLTFLETCGDSAQVFVDMLKSEESMTNLAFLVDICGHLNKVNLKLQGKDKSIIDMHLAVKSFALQLSLFNNDIQADMLHFPCLKSLAGESEELNNTITGFCDFIDKIKEEFTMRFGQFDGLQKLIALIKSPREAEPTGDWKLEINQIPADLSAAAIQIELCELNAAENAVLPEFWKKATTAALYPNLTRLAIWLLTIFASTYLRISVFQYEPYQV